MPLGAEVTALEIADLQQRVAVLESLQEATEKKIDAMADDVRTIRDIIVAGKGSWKVLVALSGLAVTIFGIAGYVLPWLHGKP